MGQKTRGRNNQSTYCVILGGVMTVGEPGDEIVETFEFRGSLHMVTGKGIYLIEISDQIDPERTNQNIPNTHQTSSSMRSR